MTSGTIGGRCRSLSSSRRRKWPRRRGRRKPRSGST
nr:MAG TPA: hypothetical protein [Caudoviricetes sp.]